MVFLHRFPFRYIQADCFDWVRSCAEEMQARTRALEKLEAMRDELDGWMTVCDQLQKNEKLMETLHDKMGTQKEMKLLSII